MYRLRTEKGANIYLLGVVKGLISEAERIETQIDDIDFKEGGLPISEEELSALEEVVKNEREDIDYELTTPERAYARNLSRFGKVKIPPPSYISLLKICRERDIKVNGLDMDEEHYTMSYCDNVSGFNWIMQSFREKRLLKKKIKADDAVDFALKWDKKINRLSGYKKLEQERERVMAKNINRISKRGDLLSIVEIERVKGIVESLTDNDCSVLSARR